MASLFIILSFPFPCFVTQQNHFQRLDEKFTISRYAGDTGEELKLRKSMFVKTKHNEAPTPERVCR